MDEVIIKYINSVRWKYAASMPRWPHEYTLKEWDLSKADIFNKFVVIIREQGYEGFFFKKRLIYLDIGEYKYWTMGNPLPETLLINRAKR